MGVNKEEMKERRGWRMKRGKTNCHHDGGGSNDTGLVEAMAVKALHCSGGGVGGGD
jgi:hypothetical protein